MVDSKIKDSVTAKLQSLLPRFIEISDHIGVNPELGSEEYKSSQLLQDELEKHGFQVKSGLLGMETAFKAVYRGKSGGQTVAYLCEYDSLPGVGHGCGHNIIGTAGMGAGIVVSQLLKDLAGEVWVIGTPAEESRGPSGSSKIRMSAEGVFDEADVVMMVHPAPMPPQVASVATIFLAISKIEIRFKGKTAHGAADPHKGVNALNAAVLTYMAIHANRQQLRRDANAVVHGVITEGGLANNVIPDKAVMEFGVRSSDDSYIPTLIEMVENSAKGAAIATGCEVEVEVVHGLKSNIRNRRLEQLFIDVFSELDVVVEDPNVAVARTPSGSTDFSNVTHVVPAIHPIIGISDSMIPIHSREFAEASLTETAHKGLETGIKALAMAGLEILTQPELLKEIKKDYENTKKQ